MIVSLNGYVNKEKPISNCILLFISLPFFVSWIGCVSQRISPGADLSQPGSRAAILIQTKAQIKSNNETNTVKIEIALLPQKAIRLEVTATLGVSVATVLLTPTEISYAMHSSKQFATGPFHARTLYPVFKKNIDPRILWRFIHGQSITNLNLTGLNLNCVVNNELKSAKCTTSDGTTITCSYGESPYKRIDVIGNRFEMNWIFRDQSLLGESQDRTFVLKKPENYQGIIIK